MARLNPEPSARPKAWWPIVLGVIATVGLVIWFMRPPDQSLTIRVPGTDQAPGSEGGGGANPVLAGKVTKGDGQPGDLPGDWPQFRGPGLDGISREKVSLTRSWQASGPRELWSVEVGEGYAGPAVHKGRVYLMDYDREKKQDALRCLSLADGREIWRFAYSVPVKRNHGMSRTVPVVNDKYAVSMGPKCHVACVDAVSGELKWGMDLVRQFGSKVPQWYAGQCPLIEQDKVILAPAGKSNLVVAVEAETGRVIWESPNPRSWKMTHVSITPMEFEGARMYVYCGDKGVAGISAKDGALLWDTLAWKISIATVPSPVALSGGRIFLSGGYNAGSMMLQLKKEGAAFKAEVAFKLEPEVFGATQHTPILFEDNLYGARADGKFACLDQQGKVAWTSAPGQQFGLGPFLIADGCIFSVNDSGMLRLIEAAPGKYNLLAQAQVLKGRESWGPLAIAGGRLLARDLTRMVCLDVAGR